MSKIDFTDVEVAEMKDIYESISKNSIYSRVKDDAIHKFVNSNPDSRGCRDFVTECWISTVVIHLLNAGYEVKKHEK